MFWKGRGSDPQDETYGPTIDRQKEESEGIDQVLIDFLKSNIEHGNTVLSQRSEKGWRNAQRAVNNMHIVGSKYWSKMFKQRSKVFKPRSKAVLLKRQSDIQDAMFSTNDYVHVEAVAGHDDQMKAAAVVLKALMNIYLDKAYTQCGFDWFMTAMGAAQTATVTGIVWSKIYWKYEYQEIFIPAKDEEGNPVLDENGEPLGTVEKVVISDHPIIDQIPPEDVIMDPAAKWTDPAQSAMWISAAYPLHIEEVLSIMKRSKEGPGQWMKLDRSILEKAHTDNENQSLKDERDQVANRYENYYDKKSRICWLRENFVRMDGVDYHFWTVGNQHYLSKPVPTIMVYPEQKGRRPYHMGYGSLEAHTIYPMSPIETVQPVQWELNDLTNLALDNSKNALQPYVLARRGARLDMKQLQQRTAGSVVQVDDVERDIKEEKPNPPDYSAWQQMSMLNTDFDDVFGVFGQSSVANNRQLNETVGGMQMLSSNANKVATLHVAIFMQTWTEPVLRKLMNCIQYFADDEKVIALAGRNSEMFRLYQQKVITDEMLNADVTVRVDYGNGTQDPQMRMQKLMGALGALGQVFGPHLFAAIKIEDVVRQVMGAAGDIDGQRYINSDILKMVQQNAVNMIGKDPEAERDKARIQSDVQKKQMEIEGDVAKTQIESQTKISIEDKRIAHEKGKAILDSRTELISAIVDIVGQEAKNRIEEKKADQQKLTSEKPSPKEPKK